MDTLEKRATSYVRNTVDDKLGSFLSISFPKISANKWTAMGFLTSIAAVFIIVKCGLLWGALAVVISASFDLVDGAVARKRKKESRFGAFMDDVVDRFGESFYFIAIFLLQPNLALMVVGITSILVSYFKADGERRGFKISSGGATGRFGRIILLAILMLFSPLFLISKTLWLIVALNILTIVKRGYEVYQQRHQK